MFDTIARFIPRPRSGRIEYAKVEMGLTRISHFSVLINKTIIKIKTF